MHAFLVKKRHIVLLELLIAMALTMIVLSTLAFFYYEVSVMDMEMERDQTASFEKLFIENRLAQVLPKTIFSKDFHFFTSPDLGGLFKPGTKSLIFTFDNGVQADKEMSYLVIGEIFVDREGNLILARWPEEKRWKENVPPPLSKEVLLENVERLSFEFFIPPDKGKAGGGSDQKIASELKNSWISDWKKEYRELPAIIKLSLTRKVQNKEKEETLTFAFPLPHTQNPIIYTE